MKSDVILVGGGLANCLIAYRLAQLRPELGVTVVEREESLGGNHLWSFHDSDLSEDQLRWISPLVVARWSSYEVRFPELHREIEGGYASISSDRLDEVTRGVLTEGPGAAGNRLLLGAEVLEVEPQSVTLTSGERLEAPLVIDARGVESATKIVLAYQKFLGQQVELVTDHDLSAPILMDATVEQRDGYRFLYTLPLTARSLLIEDTRYSDGADLDLSEMRAAIERYAKDAGWRVGRVVSEEQGVLPIVLAGDIEAFWSETQVGVPRAGLRAMLFHQTTGYSLPDAVRLADQVASIDSLTSESLYETIRRLSMVQWRRQAYFRLLNRMLFVAARPEERYKVLQRFYRLPRSLIQRFYAGRPSALDRARVLVGRPPVPVGKAISCLSEASVRRSSSQV